MAWNERILNAVAGRSHLTAQELADEFEVPRSDGALVCQALTVFEQEYGVPAGMLRASDPLDLFTELPAAKRNPFTWLFDRAGVEDRTSELGFQLKLRRKEIGLSQEPVRGLHTLRDYVLAWLGRR